MDYERIRTFINSYNDDETGLLGKVYSEALLSDIPVIRKENISLIRLLIAMTDPERILEVGTAIGFSAMVMSEAAPDAEIITIELSPGSARKAEENTSEYKNISVIEGDAAEVLEEMTESEDVRLFDLIFIDAAKAQYHVYFDLARKLSHPGTVIVCDNIFCGGNVLESHFLVEKRDRTIHDRMRRFLLDITKDPGLTSSILSVGDGMTVSVVKRTD